MPESTQNEPLNIMDKPHAMALINALADFYLSQGLQLSPFDAELQQHNALEHAKCRRLITPIYPSERDQFIDAAQERAIQAVIKRER